MNKLTFENIDTIGHMIDENTLYKHYHYPEMLIRYDSNFIDFKRVPTWNEFEQTAAFLMEFHKRKGQNHIKFYLPENKKPSTELLIYFKEKEYEIGFLELYSIEPNLFPPIEENPDIKIEFVTDKSLETFLLLKYEQDLQFGEAFAKYNHSLNKRLFKDAGVKQIIAYYKGNPAGSVDVIIKDETAEMDSLDVNETLRKKGIGSRLQKFVMEAFHDKTIILVADGEDTAREMYRKQNYQYHGFKYEILKIF
ncbi:GNAT family N-acetyltransferase [Oceanobacillus saliphilus]|uniref:GNAT family N-acetyltransferase n=1 Tax=Oceanobacillus saliphilus TaxID=2925834 RepID=UPI00201D5EBC|nr:GNAT family N-acetyltransferase [Oceanobacillus saliphilus]